MVEKRTYLLGEQDVTIVSKERPSTAFNEIRMGCLNRFAEAAECLFCFGDTGAARFHLMMGWHRMMNTGPYAPGSVFDAQFPGWRDDDAIDEN